MPKTGYEVTFDAFLHLVSDPYCLPDVAPLLKKWFSYEIVQVGPPVKAGYKGETVIRDAAGNDVNKERLHETIQSDAEMQGSLYRTSQTLWR
ncbi:MAG: hypothetical protein ABJB74_11140 [Gemmatimonas sp.]